MKKILLLMMILGLAFAGLSIDNYTVTKGIFKPGEPGVATVTVTNPVGSERVTAVTMTVNAPSELAVTSAPNLADINSGGSAIVSIPFKVKESVNPGIYTINVFFRGTLSSEASSLSQTSVNSVSIPITVVNEPELSFSSDKQVLTGSDDVLLTIENNGGIANNLRISLPGSISLYGKDQIYIGKVEKSKQVSLTLDSRDAQDGSNDLEIKIEYEDALGIPHSETVILRMTVRKEQLDLKFTQSSEINIRQEQTLVLEVTNNGEEHLEDVELTFTNDTIRLVDDAELKFGDLAPGESSTVSAKIYTEISPGINLVPSRIQWIEREVQKEELRNIAFSISSDSDVSVFLEAKPLPLMSGGEHTISVLVSNLGTYSIESVDVSISSPVFSTLDISNKQYIGGLQRDDFSTVQFLVKINPTEPGDYPVKLDIKYRDQSGDWKQKSITQNISVHGATASEDSPLGLIAIAVIAVVGIWYFKFRK